MTSMKPAMVNINDHRCRGSYYFLIIWFEKYQKTEKQANTWFVFKYFFSNVEDNFY